jgi:CCR4-Not complex component, Not1
MFEKIEPLNFPGFSFVWLELISNKYYLPALLNKVNLDYYLSYKFFKLLEGKLGKLSRLDIEIVRVLQILHNARHNQL